MENEAMWQAIGKAIGAATGEDFAARKCRVIGGGIFEAEADGLREIAETGVIRVPQPVCAGVAEDSAFLVLEYFDPAVYYGYGDRETDLAMTELFGGFPAAYREAFPLDSGYPMRKALYNLYHILNHLNMFGAGYTWTSRGADRKPIRRRGCPLPRATELKSRIQAVVLTFCPRWGGMFTDEDFVDCVADSMSAAALWAWISWDFLKTSYSTMLPTDWPDAVLTDDALEMSTAVSHSNNLHYKYSTEWFFVRKIYITT